MGSGVRGPFRLLLSRSGAKDNSVKRTIADGVTQGLFGYASKDPRGQIRSEKMRESLFDAEVDISDDAYILKAEDSQKLLEPPRLAKLNIRPENVVESRRAGAILMRGGRSIRPAIPIACKRMVGRRRHDCRCRLVHCRPERRSL